MYDRSVSASSGRGGETHALPRTDRLTFARCRLEVTGGPDQGQSFESDAREVVLGTVPGCQLVLTDPTVSRHHCSITATPAGFQVRDLGSTNGTRVGDLRVEAAYLPPRTTLRLGQTAVRFEALGDEVEEPLSADERFGHVLGRSAAMRRLFALVPTLAASSSTVLLEGETGTGKSLLARAVHEASPRSGAAFIVVDCGTIPPTLIESELFGHDKGAFTGAVRGRAGAFEAAQGGTLFLDEIGELPLEMQPKLLRALEERVVQRIGSTTPVALDVRVMAATNRDLHREVNRGTFRADLYYRLNVVRLRVPSLRERRDDVPLLVAHFYRQLTGRDDEGPPAELLASLLRQDWPGNVRELRGAVERAVLLAEAGLDDLLDPAPGPAAETASVPPAPGADEPFPAHSFRADKERAVAAWERWFVTELVRRHDGNLTRAARAARMDRNHLRELLHRHGVRARED